LACGGFREHRGEPGHAAVEWGPDEGDRILPWARRCSVVSLSVGGVQAWGPCPSMPATGKRRLYVRCVMAHETTVPVPTAPAPVTVIGYAPGGRRPVDLRVEPIGAAVAPGIPPTRWPGPTQEHHA
jgi:hypothetical protein